jgi:hypothetical protein
MELGSGAWQHQAGSCARIVAKLHIYSDKLTKRPRFFLWRDETLAGGPSLEYMCGKSELNMHYGVCGIVLTRTKKGNLGEESRVEPKEVRLDLA